MQSEKILNLITDQMNREIEASHAYLQSAGHFKHISLDHIATFCTRQSYEELEHMQKMFDYIADSGILPKIAATHAPKIGGSVLEIFQGLLDHEIMITKHIVSIAKTALQDGDMISFSFMQYFVDEQKGEVEKMRNIIDKINMIGENSIYRIDKYFAKLNAKSAT